jgi:hypothetical protein
MVAVDSPAARSTATPMIRDRGLNYTAASDAVLADARIRTPDRALQRPDAAHECDRRTLDRQMPPRASRPHPHLE